MNQSGSLPVSNSAKVDSEAPKVQSSQDEDGFIDIQHADVEMSDRDTQPPHQSSEPLQLHRFQHPEEVDEAVDEEDDSEDDSLMANHPLLNMLTGRLGARRRGSIHKWDRLHPENQALSVADVDQCVSLEDAAFPPDERATREKVRHLARDMTPIRCSGVAAISDKISMPQLTIVQHSFNIALPDVPS